MPEVTRRNPTSRSRHGSPATEPMERRVLFSFAMYVSGGWTATPAYEYLDADLNGTVNAADYLRVDNGFIDHLTGWANGDFNYDGVVDGSDYTLMDNAFNQQATPAVTPAITPAVQVVAAAAPAAEAVGSAGSAARVARPAGHAAAAVPASTRSALVAAWSQATWVASTTAATPTTPAEDRRKSKPLASGLAGLD